MRINIDKYRENFDWVVGIIKREYEKRGIENVKIIEEISQISATSGVPLLAIAHFVGEEFGYTPEICNSIQKIIDFYGYTNIDGIREKDNKKI